MAKVSQREGVFMAVMAFCSDNGISFDQGKEAFQPTSDGRKTIVEMVTNAMAAGEIELSEEARAKYDTPAKLKSYCNGLVSNWLRKDKRLNGGVKYEAKNPGSRAGSGDEVIRELRKLLKITKDESHRAAIEAEIDKRLEVIRAEKGTTVTIDVEKLPEELRYLVNA